MLTHCVLWKSFLILMKYWKSMKDLAPPFTWKHPFVCYHVSQDVSSSCRHSQWQEISEKAHRARFEKDLNARRSGSDFILHTQGGPSRKGMAKLQSDFKTSMPAELRRSDLRRENEQWNDSVVFFLAVVSSLYIRVPQMTDKSRPRRPQVVYGFCKGLPCLFYTCAPKFKCLVSASCL